MATISTSPRTREDIFKDYRARHSGLVRALTYDVDEFYLLCDPEKENLCLYGHPNEAWERKFLQSFLNQRWALILQETGCREG